MQTFISSTTSPCSFSHHIYPGYIEFTHPLVQQIWEEKFLPSFTPFLPSHMDLVVDVVDNPESSGKTLRLLAIYNAELKSFDCRDKTLQLFSFFCPGLYLDYHNKQPEPLQLHVG
ncbi:hypothetical protein CN918_25495 [Priestia megaterium]|nr:hypothetical protein CN918_25495 [Priestia megaterium]